jgi:hypothetical protein
LEIVRYYRYYWKNRTIPRGTIVKLIKCGKLNTVQVEALDGRQWTTDRRALRTYYIGPREDWNTLYINQPISL